MVGALDAAEVALATEEAEKTRLVADLNTLIFESSTSHFEHLQKLTQQMARFTGPSALLRCATVASARGNAVHCRRINWQRTWTRIQAAIPSRPPPATCRRSLQPQPGRSSRNHPPRCHCRQSSAAPEVPSLLRRLRLQRRVARRRTPHAPAAPLLQCRLQKRRWKLRPPRWPPRQRRGRGMWRCLDAGPGRALQQLGAPWRLLLLLRREELPLWQGWWPPPLWRLACKSSKKRRRARKHFQALNNRRDLRLRTTTSESYCVRSLFAHAHDDCPIVGGSRAGPNIDPATIAADGITPRP